MAEIANEDVEILVHTTAASGGRDDARYRALAQAYLDFEPITTCRLDTRLQETTGDVLEGEADTQLHGGLLQSTQDERESRASYQPEDDESGSKASLLSSQYQQSSDRQSPNFPASSQLSFRSVLDNVNSPAFRARTPHHEQAPVNAGKRHFQSSEESWVAANTVEDSQPEYEHNLLAYSSPTRVLETYLYNQTRLGSSPVLPAPLSPKVQQASSGYDGVDDSEDIITHSLPSPQKRGQGEHIEENTFGMCSVIEETDICLKQKQTDSVSDHTYLPPVAHIPASGSQLSARSTRALKRQRVESSKPRQPAFTQVTKVNMSMDVTSSMVSNTGSSDWSNSLEIRPSLPRTSSNDLTADMLITESLSQLKAKILSRGQSPYVPLSQSRELRPMERGYWLVNCEKWEMSRRSSCWDFLGKYVGRDMAGWGVSCTRDSDIRSIRVYCWGVVTEHIYLLLHMASASKVKGTGVCWIGGDGKVVIEMPS